MFTLTFPEAVFIRANSLPAPINAASSSKPVPEQQHTIYNQIHQVTRLEVSFNVTFDQFIMHQYYYTKSQVRLKKPRTTLLSYFQTLTDNVEVLLQVKERNPTGMQTFPCQLQLQLLLQGWVGTHGVDPYHKTILQKPQPTGRK